MYASVNSFAHRFNMYPSLQNIVYFINSTFVKKTHYPIISICLFIIVVILNSFQYANNKNYLQDKVIKSNKDDSSRITNIDNTLLYIYDFIGINGFIGNTPAHIFFFMLTYFCLSLIELNIGHYILLFLLLIDLMFQFFWDMYQDAVCSNTISTTNRLYNAPYCCGSFILFMALGFVLTLILKNIKNIYELIFIIILIICVFFGCVLYEIHITFKLLPDSDEKTCKTYTWHGANYIFGIICALALGN